MLYVFLEVRRPPRVTRTHTLCPHSTLVQSDRADLTPADILRLSPLLRRSLNEKVEIVHPENPTIRGVSHILWTGKPTRPEADARNAVFYADKAIEIGRAHG